VRRLIVFVSVVVAVDTTFFTALTPLLPHFADKYGLSKAGAGVFISAYAAGVLVAAVPAGLATTRLGAKRTVLGGLILMTAASVAFALAGQIWQLMLARVLQGVGSAFSWAGGLAWVIGATPQDRRGRQLGTAMGASVFGALIGPGLGAGAGVIGTRAAFLAVAVAGVVLVGWAAAMPSSPPERGTLKASVLAVRERTLVTGLWLIVLAALLFGVLIVLVPLHLHRHGWGTIAIGALFIATTALELVLNPLLGRFADRHGRLRPIRAALLGSIGVSIALALAQPPALVVLFVLAAGIAYGAFFTPGMALISDGAERASVALGLVFGLMNAGWAIGAIVGPAAGGALAGAAGDSVPYLILAAMCAGTYAVLRGRALRPVGDLP
jgi:MFS family permease